MGAYVDHGNYSGIEPSNFVRQPLEGEVKYEGGEVLVYTGSEWVPTVTTPDGPLWMTMWYVFSIGEKNIGMWSGVLDDNNRPTSWTVHTGDGDGDFTEVKAKYLSKIDYETMIAFKAMPVMDIERESPSGILLKFPD